MSTLKVHFGSIVKSRLKWWKIDNKISSLEAIAEIQVRENAIKI
jgi:hypothetical protein